MENKSKVAEENLDQLKRLIAGKGNKIKTVEDAVGRTVSIITETPDPDDPSLQKKEEVIIIKPKHGYEGIIESAILGVQDIAKKIPIQITPSKKRPRHDMMSRVALAKYYLFKGICRTVNGAAKKAHASPQSMRIYGESQGVSLLFTRFLENPDIALKLEKEISNRKGKSLVIR